MNALNYILTQLGQASTWRGLIYLATAAGIMVDEQQAAAIVAAGLALAGLINVFRKS